VPGSASQAVQEIKTAAGQASGELSGAQQRQLSQIISTLKQEINSGQSISTGLAQLWGLLHSGELPSSLNTYLTELATYLSASQGS
jgi:type II secretory pathway component PulF